jgi:endo-1,4-beta-xylanase
MRGRYFCVAIAAAAVLAAVTSARGDDGPVLKALVPKGLLIGSAVSPAHTSGTNAAEQRIVLRHFNTITNENVLKPEPVHPEPDRYNWAPADEYVAFGETHGMFIVGHVLVWHQQTPAWMFEDVDGRPLDRDTALARLKSHIDAVVGRYRGRVHAWDVVNEAVEEDGTPRKTPWLQAIGDDYVAKAFEFAHAADPQAELYYNDYNMWSAAKRAGALRIVKDLRARGLRVDALGAQGHWLLATPSLKDIEAIFTDAKAAGVKVAITELDVDVLPREARMHGADLSLQTKMREETNLYPNGLPEAKQQELANRYADIFRIFMRHRDTLTRVTFWGVTDGHSWLNNFPVRGRVNYPLLWDRTGGPKAAFHAVVKVLQESPEVSQ